MKTDECLISYRDSVVLWECVRHFRETVSCYFLYEDTSMLRITSDKPAYILDNHLNKFLAL